MREEIQDGLSFLHFLWMVKDRLNRVSNVYLAAVCKDWNLASASYTPKPQKCFPPFIMHEEIKDDNAYSGFLDFSAFQHEPTCVTPEQDHETYIIASRGGWVLLTKNHYGRTLLREPLSIFLLHLQTNVKIAMPTLEQHRWVRCASFSSSGDGTPSFVVLATWSTTKDILYVANVGDEKWKNHVYGIGREIGVITSVVVVGSKIYCLDKWGAFYTFDKINHEWEEITDNYDSTCEQERNYMMESEEGEIMRVIERINSETSRTYKFFKFNERQSYWEELSDKDTMGRSWFLSCPSQPNTHFTIAEDALVKKVYALDDYVRHRYKKRSAWIGMCVFFSDLVRKSTKKTYEFEKKRVQWVDLGLIEELPPA